MEREAFLAKVGRAVMSAGLPSPTPVTGDLSELEPRNLQALFRERAMSVSTVVHGPVSRHGAPRVIAGIAAGHDATTFMAWDDLPVSGVASTLASAGLRRTDHVVPFGETRKEHQLGYYTLGIGVTGADTALAESGSIVLLHGPGRPRMASLAPEVHIAVLEVRQIARSLAGWVAENPEFGRDSANLVVITGPSRTGDIELQLNLGVHGPRHLHVVLVN